jgi:hypothetical protein
MGQTVSFQEVLRRLAIIDESFAEDQAGLRLDLPGSGLLDPKTAALVQVGTLVNGRSTGRCTGCSSSCPNRGWDPKRVNARRLELLLGDPATAPHGGGVLVIDDSGDRRDGVKTAHVGRQWLGRYGKTDSGVDCRHHAVGRRARLLSGARGALHPGPALRE